MVEQGKAGDGGGSRRRPAHAALCMLPLLLALLPALPASAQSADRADRADRQAAPRERFEVIPGSHACLNRRTCAMTQEHGFGHRVRLVSMAALARARKVDCSDEAAGCVPASEAQR
jgi:hypothetical protein